LITAKNAPPAGLTRGSTSFLAIGRTEDVDGRVKPGQGD